MVKWQQRLTLKIIVPILPTMKIVWLHRKLKYFVQEFQFFLLLKQKCSSFSLTFFTQNWSNLYEVMHMARIVSLLLNFFFFSSWIHSLLLVKVFTCVKHRVYMLLPYCLHLLLLFPFTFLLFWENFH